VALSTLEHQYRPDALVDFRVYTTKWISLAGIVLLTPFAISHLVWGQLGFGFGLLAITAVLCFLAYISFRDRFSNWSLLLFVPILLLVASSVQTQGVVGVMWSYPAIVSFYFMFRQRWAWVANAIVILVIVPLAAQYLPTEVALRAMVTFVLVSMFSILAVRVIDTQQQRLESLAITDSLTGLLNRSLLGANLDQALARRRRAGESATLLAIDVDNFKDINDAYGHQYGDQVLVTTATMIKTRLRASDIVFRTGGEEFAVLLPDTKAEPARHVAQMLRTAVEAETLVDEENTITISLGVSELRDEDTVESWFARADRCLYQAKRQGRNCVISDAVSQQKDAHPETSTELGTIGRAH